VENVGITLINIFMEEEEEEQEEQEQEEYG
jgi:hypothetical protein